MNIYFTYTIKEVTKAMNLKKIEGMKNTFTLELTESELEQEVWKYYKKTKVAKYEVSNFGRFRKKEEPVIEEKTPILEDRMVWVSILQRIAFPVLDSLSSKSFKKKMPYESISAEGQKFAYLEAFASVFNGISPWLELGPDSSDEGQLREKYIRLTLRSIINAINPNSSDFIFVIESKQSLFNVALFAQGLLQSVN